MDASPPTSTRPEALTTPDTTPPTKQRAGARRGYFLPGVIALIALLVLGLVWGAGDLEHPAATSLTGSDTASQIALGIQAQQDLSRAPDVTCPAREPVRSGLTFDCRLAGSPPRTIHVTEIDSRGEVRWSLAPAT
jgi:hypothetical protein